MSPPGTAKCRQAKGFSPVGYVIRKHLSKPMQIPYGLSKTGGKRMKEMEENKEKKQRTKKQNQKQEDT